MTPSGIETRLPDHWRTLNSLGQNSSNTIRDIINNMKNKNIKSEADVYSIAGIGCDKNYIGKISR